MPIAIEREPSPCRPAVPHSPQHCQGTQLVEPITGINERCSDRLSFLSEELKGSQSAACGLEGGGRVRDLPDTS